MIGFFDGYLHALRQDRDDKTELSDRSALQSLLEKLCAEADPAIRLIHEAKKVPGKGGPDFKAIKNGMIVGYVEVKALGANLDEVLKSDQIKRYKQLSGNILLTDYLQFIWLRDGKVNGRELLAFPSDLEGRPQPPRPERVQAIADLLAAFFSTPPEGIGRASRLALALATRSHLLREFLGEELERQEREHREGRLYGLYEIFRDQIFHELTLGEFADAFAQMLAYGLFLARLNSGDEAVTLANARQFVPGSFRLIRELVQFLDDLSAPEYGGIRWVIEEILSIVNGLDLTAIREDLSFRNRRAISRNVRARDEEEHRLFERDPFIYFYEDFLAKYDSKMKKSRGVYYTPPPVVNFIVRAIDDILRQSFGIGDGLADHKKVTVLDFACGTGTFLLEVFERIFDNIGGADTARAALLTREHLLKNIFGFEYLIAPYTIAHLKLSQYLADKGHALGPGERLQVFLTNTLEPIEPQKNFIVPAVTAEVEAAQMVKEKPILVITGNPPYYALSRNMGKAARALIEKYKFIDGVYFGEKKHWLHDDYVKFIAFAEEKMLFCRDGVVGVITNHSWIDNPTFRGMRHSLMQTFDQIYIIDLHGSTKKKQIPPDGSKDENVFDIEQGVAISVFVRSPDLPKAILHAEMWGTRIEKYLTLSKVTLGEINWQNLTPAAPHFLFIPQNQSLQQQYNGFYAVDNIFKAFVTGVVTARDGLVVAIDDAEIAKKIETFLDQTISDDEIRQKYSVGDNYQWKLADVRSAFKTEKFDKALVRSYAFRPFDERKIYYDRKLVFRTRDEVMRHLVVDNIALLTTRITKDEGAVFCSSSIAAHKSASSYDITYVFPLRLIGETKEENFHSSFRQFIDARYTHHYTPEEILGYIYAVLHAPTYRRLYAEFLRIDFPRVPFPERAEDFERLSLLGWALVQAHLLREFPRQKLGDYHGKGDNRVEFVRYAEAEESVAINDKQFFAPVPQNVWDFDIGGYQVLEKYLKSRKGRVLTLDEIDHVAAIAASLAFTVEQMQKIDAAYRAAFPDRG